MQAQTLNRLRHSHDVHPDSTEGERRTRWVVWITAVTMVVAIAAGDGFGAMALLADGWHMGTHRPRDPAHYRGLLRELPQRGHLTAEVHSCRDAACSQERRSAAGTLVFGGTGGGCNGGGRT